uniref:Uncharacterized protein n=1 Tax=Rhizophora mucronata TaxID=61149 RepID=A0A2P2P7P4_RHIMU
MECVCSTKFAATSEINNGLQCKGETMHLTRWVFLGAYA